MKKANAKLVRGTAFVAAFLFGIIIIFSLKPSDYSEEVGLIYADFPTDKIVLTCAEEYLNVAEQEGEILIEMSLDKIRGIELKKNHNILTIPYLGHKCTDFKIGYFSFGSSNKLFFNITKMIFPEDRKTFWGTFSSSGNYYMADFGRKISFPIIFKSNKRWVITVFILLTLDIYLSWRFSVLIYRKKLKRDER